MIYARYVIKDALRSNERANKHKRMQIQYFPHHFFYNIW